MWYFISVNVWIPFSNFYYKCSQGERKQTGWWFPLCSHLVSIRVGSVKVVFHNGSKIFIENTEELGETRLESSDPKWPQGSLVVGLRCLDVWREKSLHAFALKRQSPKTRLAGCACPRPGLPPPSLACRPWPPPVQSSCSACAEEPRDSRHPLPGYPCVAVRVNPYDGASPIPLSLTARLRS